MPSTDRWPPALTAHLCALAGGASGGPGHGAAALAVVTRTPRPRDVRCSGFVPVGAWIADVPRLLEGEPGAGKTSALRAIADELARAALAGDRAVPAMLPAAAVAAAAAAARSPDGAAAGLTAALAAATATAPELWRELLDRGEGVVLLDALDEVTGADRARLREALAGALAAWPGLRCVIASRSGATDDVRALGFRRTAIEPLDEEAAAAWVAGTSPAAAAALAAAPALAAVCRTPRASAQLAAGLAAGAVPDAPAARGTDPVSRPGAPQLAPVPGRPDVEVGLTPVTVAEYAAFVEDGGYREPRWWGAGWTIRAGAGWPAPARWPAQLRTPDRPVVYVSWYEARAYAAWQAAATGRALALVSSAAWQAAATHPEGPYPWGAAEPSPDLLNFDQHVGHATPVGRYPRGAAPGGHLDLAGNVWEWCRDRAGGGTRVVRGGGWYSAGKYTRADYLYGFDPANRFHDLGLRLAVEPAILPEDD